MITNLSGKRLASTPLTTNALAIADQLGAAVSKTLRSRPSRVSLANSLDAINLLLQFAKVMSSTACLSTLILAAEEVFAKFMLSTKAWVSWPEIPSLAILRSATGRPRAL